MWCMIR